MVDDGISCCVTFTRLLLDETELEDDKEFADTVVVDGGGVIDLEFIIRNMGCVEDGLCWD